MREIRREKIPRGKTASKICCEMRGNDAGCGVAIQDAGSDAGCRMLMFSINKSTEKNQGRNPIPKASAEIRGQNRTRGGMRD